MHLIHPPKVLACKTALMRALRCSLTSLSLNWERVSIDLINCWWLMMECQLWYSDARSGLVSMSVCSLGYKTENTPGKKTSLRWGDDCSELRWVLATMCQCVDVSMTPWYGGTVTMWSADSGDTMGSWDWTAHPRMLMTMLSLSAGIIVSIITQWLPAANIILLTWRHVASQQCHNNLWPPASSNTN